jgi:DNA-directed RNA polymerase subunit beta'
MIHELMARGYTQTPRSAKLMVENREPVVYKVLEYVVRDHPVLLNRAPTLHRLGIQAFQPVLVDGKAIQLHPLVCSAFNADFDGDQMAVHLPLSLEAQMEARMLMLASHNILHPANGQPIAVPSQDMVLGCYYLTLPKEGDKGEGKLFGSIEEGLLAYENKAVGLHAIVNVRHNGKWIKNTTVGRIIFNSILPEGVEFVNDLINKKKLTQVVSNTYFIAGNFQTVIFLDQLKDLGFSMATVSGASIAISDVLIPDAKDVILESAQKEVDEIKNKYDRHILTDGERYNKVIDIWTHATNRVAASMMDSIREDRHGFNPVYMMADSGARGSQDQIKQLAGMRGLMAKPQKSMKGGVGEIIESPITSNFKEGLSVFEYFISTHGARKGLADTALKTADAGYLTRRLVDVAQDVVVYITDCDTINGILIADLKEGEELIESLSDRILGRTVVDDFIMKGEVVVKAGSVIEDDEAEMIGDSGVENIRIRSILTCEAKRGCCAKCYGWDLSTHQLVDIGTAVGIRAAQSIGEPGTQLTLRTFHIGGTATRIIEKSEMTTKRPGTVKFSDNYDFADTIDESGTKVRRCMVRHAKLFIINKEGQENATFNVPYGSNVFVNDGDEIAAKTTLIQWDPYTDIILARETGLVSLNDFIEGETYAVESVEGGKKQMVVVEARDRKLSPHIEIIDKEGKILAGGTILPVKATLVVTNKQKVARGQTLVKIPKEIGKTRDITGGLPRVAELFEARKPSNPAVMTEINGTVSFGDTKRGVRKIHVMGVDGEERKYSIPYGKHVIVHDGDYINAGTNLCEGAISPEDILHVLGPAAVRDYLVNEIQEVYRLQGVKINDKHIEVIVGQMMLKVSVKDTGDTRFLEEDRIAKRDFFIENNRLSKMIIVNEVGDSDLEEDSMIDRTEFLEINKDLKADGKELATYRKPKPATFEPILMGITRASLNTESFISAASFQETTRVLTDASTAGKTDYLQGLKENVAVGRLIPAGTGTPGIRDILVGAHDTDEDSLSELGDAVA